MRPSKFSLLAALLAAATTMAIPAASQDRISLTDAIARDEALSYIEAAKERFECEFEERELRPLSSMGQDYYVMLVVANGDGCRDAMAYLADVTDDQYSRVLIRQHVDSNPVGPVMLIGQPLIHETNPDIENDDSLEEGPSER